MEQQAKDTPPRRMMLLADGLIATTEIVRRLLQTAGYDPLVVTPETLAAQRPFAPLLISRLASPRLGWLPDYLRSHGISYGYFLDDNFFEIDTRQDPHGAAYFRRDGVRDTLSALLQGAKLVWVQSPPLAAYLQRRFPSCNVRQTDAGVDTGLFNTVRAKLSGGVAPSSTGVLRVGYPTTPRHHLAPLITGIVRAAEERFGDRVLFEFVGWWPDDLAAAANVRTFPAITSYDEYVAFVASRRWDAGLAPLGDSVFENCKTNLKFREYAAFGIPALYSDVPLYRSCVESGVTGLLCANDPAAWVAALARLSANYELRERIRKQSATVVSTRYSNASVARTVADLMRELQESS